METVGPEVPQMVQFIVGQQGAAQFDQPGVLRRLFQDVAPVADIGHETHHQLLADRVDGRVGHLGEKLFEVGEKQLGLLGQDRQRRVVAHGARGFFPLLGHGLQNDVDVLAAEAEELLTAEQILLRFRRRDVGEKPVDRQAVLLHPAPVGTAAGQPGLDLGVLHEPVVVQVEEQYLAGLQTALALHLLRRDIQHAGLAGQHEKAVFTFRVTRGTQAVAVEDRAGIAAVGEDHGGGPVPGFHQGRMVLEETADVPPHIVLGPPGLGDQHQKHLFDGPSRGDEELQHVVQTGRIALSGVDQRQEFCKIVAEQGARHQSFAGLERVEIAPQGVDLAVVGQTAEGMGQRPRGEGVGAVPLVHDGEAGAEKFVRKIGVELPDLGRQQEPLVDHRAGGHAADVEIEVFFLDQPAHDEELAFEGVVPAEVPPVDEKLADDGAVLTGLAPDGLRDDGDLPPAEDGAALGGDHLFDDLFTARAAEDHGDGVSALLRQLHARVFAEEGVGHREEQSRAVAGLRIAARGAAVHQAREDGDPLFDDIVRRPAVEIGRKAHAAGVVFVRGIVESGRPRSVYLFHAFPDLSCWFDRIRPHLHQQKPCQWFFCGRNGPLIYKKRKR